ncbi:hypothetical protein XENORESO_011834 [Xenotaenia resolanae]|uniref:Uncharacterized protein n=1 Tax=Xenotaenia resolanae TaxID=208358 RepID=A0ABV0X265_9TELE
MLTNVMVNTIIGKIVKRRIIHRITVTSTIQSQFFQMNINVAFQLVIKDAESVEFKSTSYFPLTSFMEMPSPFSSRTWNLQTPALMTMISVCLIDQTHLTQTSEILCCQEEDETR